MWDLPEPGVPVRFHSNADSLRIFIVLPVTKIFGNVAGIVNQMNHFFIHKKNQVLYANELKSPVFSYRSTMFRYLSLTKVCKCLYLLKIGPTYSLLSYEIPLTKVCVMLFE